MKRNQGPLRARVAAKAAIFRGDQILLLHRSVAASDPGVWDLPGGVVEQGESLPRAVKREVREETGFDVRIGPMFHAELFGSFSKRGKIRPTVGFFFRAEAPTRKRPRLDPEEHTEYAWVSRHDLKDYPTLPYLARTVQTAFITRESTDRIDSAAPTRGAFTPMGHIHLPVPA